MQKVPGPARAANPPPDPAAPAASAAPAPPNSKTAFVRAKALHAAGKFAEAETLLQAAIARDPANVDLRNARGVMLAAMGKHLDAVWCYRDALALEPRRGGVWTNLGNALTRLNYLASAIHCHRRAIALSDGNDPLLHHNLGTSLSEDGRQGEAVLAFNRALELKPDYHMARWDRALAYLNLGNYRQGWVDYEIRKVTGQLPAKSRPGEPWNGEPYAGKHLVLLSEQGFGDMLWVARYFARVKALGGKLTIECRPEIAPLIATMQVADAIVVAGAALPAADLHCYICSLPGLFTPDLDAIPPPPYLTAPRVCPPKLTAAFAQAPTRLKIGIVWSGSVTFGKNQRRARSLLNFFQAFVLPGVQLYSLQKGPPEKELTSLPRGGPIVNLAPLLFDFGATAAAVAALDLIIMTDSSVAHLAGAMGKPVWILLGHRPHWLWLSGRTDSPWYPSVKLFRPRAEGDWDHVFDQASTELMKLARL